MKKTVIVYLIIILNTIANTIKIGYFDTYPMFFQGKNNKAQGSTVDYFNDFMKEIGYKVEWIGPQPFPRLLDELKTGKIDALVGFSKTEDRKTFVYYADKPYLVREFYIFLKKTNPLKEIKTIKDIENMTLTYVIGGKLPKFFDSFMDRIKMDYVSTDNWIEIAVKKLLADRTDGIVTGSKEAVFKHLSEIGKENEVKTLVIPGDEELYLGISKSSKNGKSLVEKYNKNLKKTKLDLYEYEKKEY